MKVIPPIATRSALPVWKAAGGLVLFYLAFAVFYMVSLHLSMQSYQEVDYSWGIIYLDYPLKAIFTLPVWWLTFKRLRHLQLWYRILVTLLLMPFWIKGWQLTYYWITDTLSNLSPLIAQTLYTDPRAVPTDFLKLYHLQQSGQWWDIYIPGLFYALQFGVFFAYDYYRDLLHTREARLQSEQAALQSELRALKAQLNPHFLYNCFNTISASVPAEQEYTRSLIAGLADLFRYQLRATRAEVVTLGEEVDFIRDYLELEHARFGPRLRVVVELASELRATLLPPMLLQPLVENAVRHGISPLIEGGEVRLLCSTDKDDLLIRIEDTGGGINPGRLAAATGFGLANTRRRLRLLYQRELLIESLAPTGTRLTIRIPLRYDDPAHRSTDRRRSPRPLATPAVPR